ncbi:tyrosine-type recombinase/integrase [Caproiciproducens sp.]|uniref:tyrosine-type recombinase/integrase n=1 Tax=Caproiciproducens sp. TaxID=1954376 RepID=UPI00289D056A|nr:site-specific integrase [Caproiciproducens sp.]
MKDYCSDFSDYLVNKKVVSANTLESYIRDVGHFLSFVDESGLDNPSAVDSDFMNTYVAKLMESKKSNATITRNVASIRCFYQYLIISNQSDSNPAKAIKLEKTVKKLPQILTGKEICLRSRTHRNRRAAGTRQCWNCCMLPESGLPNWLI